VNQPFYGLQKGILPIPSGEVAKITESSRPRIPGFAHLYLKSFSLSQGKLSVGISGKAPSTFFAKQHKTLQ
jgi:hypothetical protein